MPKSKRGIGSNLARVDATTDADIARQIAKDPDTAPELTQEYFERADLYHGETLIRRGRPPSARPKEAVKLRLSPDVLDHFRAGGPGWQTRINATLERVTARQRRRSNTGIHHPALKKPLTRSNSQE